MDLAAEHDWARTPWRPGSRRAYAHVIAELWSGWSMLREVVGSSTGRCDPDVVEALRETEAELSCFLAGAASAGMLDLGDILALDGGDLDTARAVIGRVWDFDGDRVFDGLRAFELRLDLMVPSIDREALVAMDDAGRRAAIAAHARARREAVETLVETGYRDAVRYDFDWPPLARPADVGSGFWARHRRRCAPCGPKRRMVRGARTS
jgi:hypothetical protein